MGNEKELRILERYKGFFKELKTENIMNKMFVVLKDENKIREAQEIMKNRQISGIPIVGDNNNLVNILTMEDIITALERGIIDQKISKLKRKEVITIKIDDGFEEIIEKITSYGYRRYPVVNRENKLIGIVSLQDLLFSVLSKLSVLYLHDERRREILDSPLSVFIQNNFNKNQPEFIYEINNSDVNNAGEGSALLKNFLLNKGFDKKIVRNISISVYEAEVNVVIHGGGVGKIIAITNNDSIVVFVEDVGPGIEDIETAMKAGYSTAPEYIRTLGFGAGMGLANIKRFADKLILTSEKEKGVKLEMMFWLENK